MGYSYSRRGIYQKSFFETIFFLVLMAILAGILGGGFVGLATSHKASPSSIAPTGLGTQ
jgi:hypothetical protein